jgi:hypothetical protein
MYSHGSSARVGVGKQGHGGRNYRPPSDRHNKEIGDLVPPPLKACDCLIQLDLPEYMQEAVIVASENVSAFDTTASSNRRRMHWCFPGNTVEERRLSVQQSQKQIRSKFGVHVLIPGRLQRGPVAIAGTSYRDTIPATTWFLENLVLSRVTITDSASGQPGSFTGRIHRNVKDPNDIVLEGQWRQTPSQIPLDEGKSFHVRLSWVFQSETWAVMTCDLLAMYAKNGSGNINQSESNEVLEHLQTCVDNLKFRLGSSGLNEIDLFLRHLAPNDFTSRHQHKQGKAWSMAFAAGHPSRVNVLLQELGQVIT